MLQEMISLVVDDNVPAIVKNIFTSNFTDFEAMQKGFERFQEANLVYHLYDDWVLEIQMGYSVNSLVIHQWKNEDWSIWEEDPVAEGVEVINTLISE